MKLLILFISVSVFFFSTFPAFAQQNKPNDDPSNIGPCKESTYCDPKDGKTLIKKFGCRIAYQYEEQCKADDAKCWERGDWCVCNTQKLPNSCGNLGGVPDAKSDNVGSVFGRITAPEQIRAIGDGEGAITNVIQLIIQGIYTISGIGFVVLFLWSIFKIITSQGDKEALMSARKTIQWAIIGLVLLAFAFPIMSLVGNILGFKFFG